MIGTLAVATFACFGLVSEEREGFGWVSVEGDGEDELFGGCGRAGSGKGG